jgi:hypothetical protein
MVHSTGVFESGGKSYPFNALTPTAGTDSRVFTQYGTNIIAGRLEVANSTNLTKNPDGSYNDNRPIRVAVYNSNGTFR